MKKAISIKAQYHTGISCTQFFHVPKINMKKIISQSILMWQQKFKLYETVGEGYIKNFKHERRTYNSLGISDKWNEKDGKIGCAM